MPRVNRVQLSSFKVNARLAAFIKERSKTHENGLTGICEELLERGASLSGYKPEEHSKADQILEGIADAIVDKVRKKLADSGIETGG